MPSLPELAPYLCYWLAVSAYLSLLSVGLYRVGRDAGHENTNTRSTT